MGRRLFLRVTVIVILLVVVAGGASFYLIFFAPNTIHDDGARYLYVSSADSFNDVIDNLERENILRSVVSFRASAVARDYDKSVRPGRYSIEAGANNYSIVTMLRSGIQEPVRLTFNNIRVVEDLAGRVGNQIEADSVALLSFLNDESNYSADGFNRATVISVFIPNTYEVFWTISPEALYRRMLREYESFWSDDKVAAARSNNLSPVEVSIVASIIDEETNMVEEMARIAGVYLNRLRLGMPLQACPTVRFAHNDFTITRILNEHIEIDSPYNTYRYSGLPPGPVRAPSINALNAVVNAEEHDYLYFAARADFSGYHHFSRTLAEHNRYAAEYRRELNKRGIFR